MKSTYILVLYVVAIVFTSCIGRMYSFRKTYPADKIRLTEQTMINNEGIEEADPITAANAQPQEKRGEDHYSIEANTAEASLNTKPAIVNTPFYKSLEPQKEVLQWSKEGKKIKTATLKKELRKKVNSLQGFDSTVRKLLIIGLICVLAAILLGIVLPPLGWIASTAGVILIVVALIIWLLNIL